MAALLIVSHLIHKETGIRFRRAGVRGNLIMAGILALTLVMFMTGLALVSVGLRWLVIGPILVTWAGGTLGAAGVLRSCVEQTSRG